VGKTRTSVLVVEDDAGIATQLVRGLRRAGTTWTTSRPGARRCAGESLGGRAARWLLLTASLLTGLLFAVVTVHLAGPGLPSPALNPPAAVPGPPAPSPAVSGDVAARAAYLVGNTMRALGWAFAPPPAERAGAGDHDSS